MHSGDDFVVSFANDGGNGGKQKVFGNFVDGGEYDVSGIDHRSMPDYVEIKISND